MNGIAWAIKLKVSGFRLWGFGRGGACGAEGPSTRPAAEAWRAVEQLMFGDDWAGLFRRVSECRVAWEMWVTWAAMVGAKIGVKLLKKTVVGGVQ